MKVGMISLLNGVDEGKTFLLKNLSVFEGGRSQGNHVLLKDDSVAMSHFRVCVNESEYVLYDQGAKNGTFVNGEQIDRVTLNPGDVIRTGNVEMRFDLVDPDTPGRLASCAPELTDEVGEPDRSEAVHERVSGDDLDSDEELPSVFEIVEGEEKGKIFELTGQDHFTIGRSNNVDLRLRDSKISRCHCTVGLVGDHFIVTDNQSSNGTIVNGERIKKTVLKDGDYIRLGFTILRFRKGSTAGVKLSV